ncbi:BTAD domain-containing putative transcriptional regulator [Paenibacillus pasadenensis]|nr:BTAD domain-containing putative transcriptional regulator [Paenibacillus pasadenensis]
MKTFRILKMKLMAPPAKSHWLQRPKLMKRLRSIPRTPLTLLASGPGFGKTTALAAYVRQCGCRYAWYGISAQDHDLLPFLHHIIASIRMAAPGFGESLLAELERLQPASPDDVQLLADLFLNECLLLSEPLLLCLDDYQSVGQNEWIDAWMQYVVSYLPDCPSLRLVVSSRVKPEWEGLTSMRVRGEVLELSRDDLAFSAEDIEVLFSDYYRQPLGREQAERLLAFTEGWIIAIQLVWQRLAATGESMESLLLQPRQSLEELFAFLAAELFEKQPPAMQAFMLETSLFDELTGEWCDAVCGREGSRAQLAALSQSGFLTPIDEHQFRYHALFRQFLQERLRLQGGRRELLLRRAVQETAAKGRMELALQHASELDDPETMAALLAAGGAQLVAGGHLEAVLSCLQPLPELWKASTPHLYVLQGDVLRYRCAYEEAMASYSLAERHARERGDALVHSLALEGQAMFYLDTIQPGLAEPPLLRAIALAEAGSASAEPAASAGEEPAGAREPGFGRKHLARLYGLMAENKLNRGHGKEARDWAARSLQLDPERRDLLLEARLALRTGRLKEAALLLESAQLQESQTGAPYRGMRQVGRTLSRSHREIELLQSLIHSLCGEAAAAKSAAESGMMRGIRLKAPFVEACGWIRMGHAAQLSGAYEAKVPAECYHAALDIMTRLDMPRGTAEPNMGLCLLHGRGRAVGAAMRYGEAALQDTERADDGWLASLIRLSMAIVLYENGSWPEAEERFEEAKARFEACGDEFGLALGEMWLAFAAYRQQQDGRFAAAMERFLHRVAQGGYSFLFTARTLLGPADPQQLVPLLLEAERLGIGGAHAAALLAELGMDKLTYHPGYTLHIETLGTFRLRLGSTYLQDKDWQRGKAKELFQLLVTKRRSATSKEELLLQLFPHADEKAANRDFKVALNALHAALEPQRRLRGEPYFVIREGPLYRLHPQASWTLDAAQFEEGVRKGLEAERRDEAERWLEQALQLYQGDYLPERRYDDWCIEERERLQVLFLRGAQRLSRICAARGAYDKSIGWAEAMLAKDRCWEEAYRMLMECHLLLGSRQQAAKWYRRAEEALEEELGVAPTAALRELMERCSEESA